MQAYWKFVDKEMKKGGASRRCQGEWGGYYEKNSKQLLASYVAYAKKFGTVRTLGEEIMRDEKVSRAAEHVERICGKKVERGVLVFRRNRWRPLSIPSVESDRDGPVLFFLPKSIGERSMRHELIHSSDRGRGGPLNINLLKQGEFDDSALAKYSEGRAYFGEALDKKGRCFSQWR